MVNKTKKRKLREAYNLDGEMNNDTSLVNNDLPFMAQRQMQLDIASEMEEEEEPCEPMVIPGVLITMQRLLSGLRSLYWDYYSSHWIANGGAYYSNHLLFQRLYEDMPDLIDVLAERMVAFYGENSVDSETIMAMSLECLTSLNEKCDKCVRSLELIDKTLEHVQITLDVLDRANVKDLGWDDYLPALSAKLEEHKYLLQQPLR